LNIIKENRQRLLQKEQGAVVCRRGDSDNCVGSQQRQWWGQANGGNRRGSMRADKNQPKYKQ